MVLINAKWDEEESFANCLQIGDRNIVSIKQCKHPQLTTINNNDYCTMLWQALSIYWWMDASCNCVFANIYAFELFALLVRLQLMIVNNNSIQLFPAISICIIMCCLRMNSSNGKSSYTDKNRPKFLGIILPSKLNFQKHLWMEYRILEGSSLLNIVGT